jgi:hypothetical protein
MKVDHRIVAYSIGKCFSGIFFIHAEETKIKHLLSDESIQ